MDKRPVYPGAIPLDLDWLQPQRNIEIALGFMLQAMLGTSAAVTGLAVTQQASPNMTVQVGPGAITFLTTVDTLGSGFGSLTVDNVDPLVKIGINLASSNMTALTAPVTSGQSQNWLVEAQFQEADASPVVLPYYNSSNPSVPYTGPLNAGTTNNTARTNTVQLQWKAGTAAATGTQTTPAPDAGWTGIAVVTVAHGQTTIVNANIATYNASPLTDPTALNLGLRPGRLLNIQTFTANGTYTPSLGMRNAIFEVQGGGGSGSGCGSASGTNVSMGAPGTAGAYAKALFTAAAIGASQPIGIGAGGASASGSAGSNGGTSSVGTAGALMSVPGGVAGTHLPNQAPPNANGNGSNSGTPTITGGTTIFVSVGSAIGVSLGLGTSVGVAGAGGASMFGAGGFGVAINNAGSNASNPGAGGGGSVCNSGPGNILGGNGFRGIVIVTEFS